MTDPHNLQRFINAQASSFEAALRELRNGRKLTHWMWFVFPQPSGLGRSPTALFYAIRSKDEARAYLDHPLLGPRLHATTAAVLSWAGTRGAEEIFGSIDALKLRSSLTLFDSIDRDSSFARALSAVFGGPDERTLALLAQAG